MENKHSARFLRQRKMMLMLPILVFPFITMGFWALGGGKDTSNENAPGANTGLNLQLPNANLKEDKNEDKLSFYKMADADSLKRAEILRNDPYYNDSILSKQSSLLSASETKGNSSVANTGLNNSLYKNGSDTNELKVNQKIEELKRQINQPETVYGNPGNQKKLIENNTSFSTDVDKLHNMMQVMNNKEDVDPEMEQLNGTLDKILDIQHPQRIKDIMKEKSTVKGREVFSISKNSMVDNISLLDTSSDKVEIITKFYGTDDYNNQSEDDNALEAVVDADQTIVSGSIIKLRLITDIFISGTLIPKGNCIYGITSLNDERLKIEINSIRNINSVFPVNLEVYDMDGLAGINIPGAIAGDVAKQSVDNGLQLVQLSSLDPSLKAQAAEVGINTVKSLMSKKVKQVKVFVKAGYKVLLKDKNLQH